MIFLIVIYRGNKIVHQEFFKQSTPPGNGGDLVSFSPKSGVDTTHNEKLLMGMLSAVNGIVAILASGDSSTKLEALSTPEYRLDYFETISGYTFVVLSKPSSVDTAVVRAEFEKLYNLLFVPLVIRNPLYSPTQSTGSLYDANCQVFVEELRNHFQCLRQPLGDEFFHSQVGGSVIGPRPSVAYPPSLI